MLVLAVLLCQYTPKKYFICQDHLLRYSKTDEHLETTNNNLFVKLFTTIPAKPEVFNANCFNKTKFGHFNQLAIKAVIKISWE